MLSFHESEDPSGVSGVREVLRHRIMIGVSDWLTWIDSVKFCCR
jgi:hypothetical protein